MGSIQERHWQRRFRQAQQQWKQAQQACHEAQQQLAGLQMRAQASAAQASALLQTMTTAILAENQDRIITLINQRLCDLFCMPKPAAAYMGQRTQQLVQDGYELLDDSATIHAQNLQIVAAQQRSSGLLIALRDGRIVQQDYLPVVQDGATVLHIWSYEDVTEQQLALRRVREFSQLAEQCPQPIIRFNEQAEALYANPAAAPVLAALALPEELNCRRRIQREISQALLAGETRTVELRLGAEFYLWTIAPLPREQEATLYLTTITERRHAEAELLRNQLFTARINETVPNIVFIYDLQTETLQYCNKQTENILGYTAEEVLALGNYMIREIVHPDDLPLAQLESRRRHVLHDGEVLASEYRFRHRNGSWRWLSLKTTCFTRHANGRVWQLVGSATDVTERRETEEQLHQSRLFVERITNTTPNLIYIYDVDTQTNVYCNRFVETMLGYTAADLQQMGGSMIHTLTSETEGQRLRQHFEEVTHCQDDEVRHLEYSLYHRSGSIRWLRISNTPFARNEQGRVTQIVGSAEDITRWKIADEQRRSANRRLAEQNRLFRQVIDTVPNPIYLKDAAGNYILANQATAQLYNLSNEALLQTPADELLRRFPDLERHHSKDKEVLSTRKEVDLEDTFVDAYNQLRWFRTVKRPFVQADGTVQVLGVDNDITELKHTEKALQQAKETAEQNAQARQTFLTNMSHEIRTPMNGIMGLAELLAKTPLSDEQQQYLHHIRYSADNLLVVINDILDMAQLGAGRVRLETVPFELQEVLKASCQALMPKATEKGITLRLQLPDEPGPTWVLGDPYRLRQVLLNLLSNAIKFTEKGQVLLTCRQLTSPNGSRQYQFSVMDTGIGIPSGQLQQLFEPFMQASASTAREYGGSGLGLSISRELVELLGGKLTAESRLHHGSTFRFTLTFVGAQPPALPLVPATAQFRLEGYRVLLTEDNPVNQLLVQVMLKGWGMHVDTASSGAEALALFRQYPYDVVLMDIQMPGMDGVATTQLLRQHPNQEKAATPVVALTAHAMQGEAERYRQAGLNAYVSKPFREEDLFRTVADLLKHQPIVTPPVPAPVAPLQTQPTPSGSPLYDLTSLRNMTNNDETFVRRLVTLFITTTPPVVAEMEQHVARQQLEALSAAAHHLKSSVDGLQVQALRPVLRELEAAGHNPEAVTWPHLTELVQQVRQLIEATIAQLRTEFPE
ncbi:PAS domain-containing hybrid sensor histidine kinase/response regulator [Hymenobacter pini]|uniref:PAS domain-containing hybrid sensor histidine kinase/response regulator n=1 Tax=Hymenobacter pini TaxID=2880879 RepID=UPI001CF38948|nr:PAS domain S-box protein [Hymenobacter pini]MCA8832072.1 PAS domain S-box protein [Hymenobacter pini]